MIFNELEKCNTILTEKIGQNFWTIASVQLSAAILTSKHVLDVLIVISRLYTRTDVHGIDEIIKKFLWYKTHWHLYWFWELLWCCWLNRTVRSSPDFQNVDAAIIAVIYRFDFSLVLEAIYLKNVVDQNSKICHKNLYPLDVTCHQHNSSPHQHPLSHFCHLTFTAVIMQ